jgi:hypothetical protein
MRDIELERLRELREVYDRTLLTCDPITHAWRNQNLLQAVTEYLIRPLQEHEEAERSSFERQNPYEDLDEQMD